MIQSFFVRPTTPGVHHIFFDTVINGTHVFTACGVGRVENGDAALTAIAQATLDELLAYAKDSLHRLVLRELSTVGSARGKVRKTLEMARDKDVVFFVCADADVYDTAIARLNVQRDSTGTVQ